MQALKLVIIEPSNVEATCLQGRGALTSFALVAEEVASLFTFCTAAPVPWGTHLRVNFRVQAPRASPRYRALCTPRPFDSYAVTADDDDWNEAVRDARLSLAKAGGIRGSFPLFLLPSTSS